MDGPSLPAEILTYIFELAVEDDGLLYRALHTCMSESQWQKKPSGEEWFLVSPTDSMHTQQIRRYSMMKVHV